MTIDSIKDFVTELRDFIPEQYVPSDFTVKICIDMDGTIAQWQQDPDYWYQRDVLETLPPEQLVKILDDMASGQKAWQIPDSGYYHYLPEMEEIVQALRWLSTIPQIKDKNGIIYNIELQIVSCAASLEAMRDKYMWLNEHTPEITNRILVPYDEHRSGEYKALAMGLYGVESSIMTEAYQEQQLKTVTIMLDDCTKVINQMTPYGVECIKALNGINDTHGSYKGPRLDITQSATKILTDFIPMISRICGQTMDRRFGLSEYAHGLNENEKIDIVTRALDRIIDSGNLDPSQVAGITDDVKLSVFDDVVKITFSEQTSSRQEKNPKAVNSGLFTVIMDKTKTVISFINQKVRSIPNGKSAKLGEYDNGNFARTLKRTAEQCESVSVELKQREQEADRGKQNAPTATQQPQVTGTPINNNPRGDDDGSR